MTSRVWLGVALVLGAALRLWGLVAGPPVWHPDEFYLVYTPLNFFSGNLDPGQGMAAFYPGFHYYLLAVCYALFLMICQVVAGVSFGEVLARFSITSGQLEPDHPTTHNNLAVALSRLGRGAEAVAHRQRSIELDPFYASPYRNLGLWHGSEYDRAIAFLKKAVQLEPERADFHNELAVAHAGKQQYAAAIAHWQKVAELTPGEVQAFYNIAVAYQHGLRRPDEAVVHWENYLASAEPRAEAYAHLIAALKSLGRREQVERWTQISSAKFPDYAQPR